MTTIQALVDRFLGWKLPATFSPDAGVKFTPSNGMSREEAYARPGWWPIGTNLLTADEARQMLEHLLGTPARMWVIGKQHPERPEVSMFTTSSEATAKEYERLGWTVRAVDVLPALGVPACVKVAGGEVPEAVFAERLACARVAEDFMRDQPRGPMWFAANTISARILGRSAKAENCRPRLEGDDRRHLPVGAPASAPVDKSPEARRSAVDRTDVPRKDGDGVRLDALPRCPHVPGAACPGAECQDKGCVRMRGWGQQK